MASNSPFQSIPIPSTDITSILATVQALRQTVNTLIVQNSDLLTQQAAATGLANRVTKLEATLKAHGIT